MTEAMAIRVVVLAPDVDLTGVVGEVKPSSAHRGEDGAADERDATDGHLRDPGGPALAGISR
jgi:hypothetical protein